MIRISDIAAELELSRVTVSAILNDRYQKLGISEKTAQRVLAQAETMGYVPNRNALSMRTCLLYTSPSPRDRTRSRMPSSA